ncbi:MAG: hypothetical protein ACK5KL_13225 [Dysgonomonas sp.]
MKKYSIATVLLLILYLLPVFSFAQVTIGEGTPPDPSALLDLKGNNLGFLGPRVELESRIDPAPVTDPVVGLMVYNLKNTNLPDKKNNVYANKYYYWTGNQWMEFVNTYELNDTILKVITKLEVPGVALFKLEGTDGLDQNNLQIKGYINFLKDILMGSKKKVPFVEVVNYSEKAISYDQATSVVTFKPGIYAIIFIYEFYPQNLASVAAPPSGCTTSSYFIDFPIPEGIAINEDRARIHSTCHHRDKANANHGGYISYATVLQDSTGDGVITWSASLGVGQSGNCTVPNAGKMPGGFGLSNDGTFLYICKLGDIN